MAHPRLIIPENLVEYQRFSLKSRLQQRFHIRSSKEPVPSHDNSDHLLYGQSHDDSSHGGALGRGSRLLFGKAFPRKGMGIHRIRDLPRELTPVVAVVNSKSGGRQGKILMQKLRRVLSRAQVIDIRRVDIQDALTLYSGLRNNVTLMVGKLLKYHHPQMSVTPFSCCLVAYQASSCHEGLIGSSG